MSSFNKVIYIWNDSYQNFTAGRPTQLISSFGGIIFSFNEILFKLTKLTFLKKHITHFLRNVFSNIICVAKILPPLWPSDRAFTCYTLNSLNWTRFYFFLMSYALLLAWLLDRSGILFCLKLRENFFLDSFSGSWN